jgi:hypothetical protein
MGMGKILTEGSREGRRKIEEKFDGINKIKMMGRRRDFSALANPVNHINPIQKPSLPFPSSIP